MQNELELRALSLILKDRENLMDFLKKGILSDSFIIYTDHFKFIEDYFTKSGDVPPVEIIKAEFKDFEEKDAKASEITYLSTKLLEHETQRKTLMAMHKAEENIQNNPMGSLDQLLQRLTSIRQARQYNRGFTDKDAMERFEEAKKRKDTISKNQVIGIKTGIKMLDEKHIGWQQGDLVSIVGRTNIGKTWLLLYIAGVAWKHGYRVLFISPEISKKKLELRWDTVVGRMFNFTFPFSKVLEGDLDYAKYEEWLKTASQRGDWLTVESYYGSSFNVPAVQSVVTEFSPDLIAVDGISLIQGQGNEDWEKVKNVAYGLKAVASTTQKVVIVTSQANKDASKATDQMPTLEHIAGSYAVAQASDIIVALGPQYRVVGKGKEAAKIMNTDMRAVSLIKMREGLTENSRTPLNFELEYGNIGIADGDDD